jgi:hypothetical protein
MIDLYSVSRDATAGNSCAFDIDSPLRLFVQNIGEKIHKTYTNASQRQGAKACTEAGITVSSGHPSHDRFGQGESLARFGQVSPIEIVKRYVL